MIRWTTSILLLLLAGLVPARTAAAAQEDSPCDCGDDLSGGGLVLQFPSMKLEDFPRAWAVLLGGGGFFYVWDNRLSVGAGGWSGTFGDGERYESRFSYGAMFLDYGFRMNDRVEILPGLRIGAGGASRKDILADPARGFMPDARVTRESSSFVFALQPGVAVALNVFQWMRLIFGASYLFAHSSAWGDIGGPSLTVGLLFGRFYPDPPQKGPGRT